MVAGNQQKALEWYDNEWGYSSRVMDLAELMVKKINGGVMEKGIIWRQHRATGSSRICALVNSVRLGGRRILGLMSLS
jgi:hypothetical protein